MSNRIRGRLDRLDERTRPLVEPAPKETDADAVDYESVCQALMVAAESGEEAGAHLTGPDAEAFMRLLPYADVLRAHATSTPLTDPQHGSR